MCHALFVCYHLHSTLKLDDFNAFVYVYTNINVWSHSISCLTNETLNVNIYLVLYYLSKGKVVPVGPTYEDVLFAF